MDTSSYVVSGEDEYKGSIKSYLDQDDDDEYKSYISYGDDENVDNLQQQFPDSYSDAADEIPTIHLYSFTKSPQKKKDIIKFGIETDEIFIKDRIDLPLDSVRKNILRKLNVDPKMSVLKKIIVHKKIPIEEEGKKKVDIKLNINNEPKKLIFLGDDITGKKKTLFKYSTEYPPNKIDKKSVKDTPIYVRHTLPIEYNLFGFMYDLIKDIELQKTKINMYKIYSAPVMPILRDITKRTLYNILQDIRNIILEYKTILIEKHGLIEENFIRDPNYFTDVISKISIEENDRYIATTQLQSFQEWKMNEFYTWIITDKGYVLENKIDNQSIYNEVLIAYNNYKDPQFVFKLMMNKLNIYDLSFYTVKDLINALTIADAKNDHLLNYILLVLLQRDNSIQGEDLAIIISNIIDDYCKYNVATFEVMLQSFRTYYLKEKFKSLLESHELNYLLVEYDRKYLNILIDLYKNAVEKQEKVKTRINIYDKIYKYTIVNRNIMKDINMYEEYLYKLYGSTSFYYMFHIAALNCMLYNIGIGSECKYFKLNFYSGNIRMIDFMYTDFISFIPEFTMNIPNLSDENIELCIRQLQIELTLEVYSIAEEIAKHVHENYKAKSKVSIIMRPFPWKKYVSSPCKICLRDTNTGFIEVVNEKGQFLRYDDIPLDRLIICYDEGKFSCYDIKYIVYLIINGINNPCTNKPFDEELINKLKDRYYTINFTNASIDSSREIEYDIPIKDIIKEKINVIDKSTDNIQQVVETEELTTEEEKNVIYILTEHPDVDRLNFIKIYISLYGNISNDKKKQILQYAGENKIII